MSSAAPVIAIDGPSASGKGSVAQRVAARLGFHYLDSGAIYRATAVAAARAGLPIDGPGAEAGLAACAARMDLAFAADRVLLGAADVTDAVRSEEGGRNASRIAALPGLRAALLERQRAFRRAPGLVADGRDMGTVVFPDARLKVFLTASVAVRALRRARQLCPPPDPGGSPNGLMQKEKGATLRAPFDAVLAQVTADLNERDRRDRERAAAPLLQAGDARELDTSAMSIDEAVDAVCEWYRSSGD
ncbi:MAG: (d)CMP kinase [Burkholderiales bacterium]|nr:(d)CMP kinase [Burkholderiales bacterium]